MFVQAIRPTLMIVGATVAVSSFQPAHAAQTDTGKTESETPSTEKNNGEASSSLYVRFDTDQTTVITPQVHFRQELGPKDTSFNILYMADMWTSASVDIRSAASPVVSETRHEVDVGVDQGVGLGSIGLGYRYSHEIDYVSHGLNLVGSYEAFSRTTTFEARLGGSQDAVGRAHDEFFDQSILSAGGWLGVSQVLSKKALVQLAYETRLALGYLSSPYRYVPVDAIGVCDETATLCLPEVHPNRKLRHSFVGRFRYSLARNLSTGADYRYYFDDWGVQSHTGRIDTSWSATRNLLLSAEYRAYTQSASTFYQPSYSSDSLPRFITRDRELSPLHNHQVALRAQHLLQIPDTRAAVQWGALLTGTQFIYRDFPGLTRVFATSLSVTLGIQY